jgi:signal transduction histidine kinase
MAITSFMGPALFLLIHTYPGEKFTLKKKFLMPLSIMTLLSAIMALSPFMFTKVTFTPDRGPQVTPGPAIAIFAINFFTSVIAGFAIVVRKYLKAKGLEKLQIRYLLLGLIITYTLFTITNFILVVFFKNTTFVPYGPMFNLIMATFIAYAIIKHRLMDIRLVVARTVSYSLLLTIIGLFYTFSLFIISSLFLSANTNQSQIIVSALMALIIAFTFQPLRRWLEHITDRIFFKERYSSETLLGNLSRLMASTLILKRLAQGVLKKITSQMKISQGALILIENGKILKTESIGYRNQPEFKTSQIVDLMETHKQSLVFEELSKGKIKNLMDELNLTFCISLKVKNKKIGLLALGGKSSGDIYSSQDIDVLEILAPQLAVAVQNAQAYEEIQRFSSTLKEKVDQATKELKKANIKLKELDLLKDEFVSVASHELRTPMTSIKNYLWMVLHGKGGKINKKQRLYLDRAAISTERLIHLVNDMLTISRIERGKIEIKPSPGDIVKLTREVVEELKLKAKEEQITLSLKLPSKSLPLVNLDEDRVREVLFNLIGNAIKFTDPKGQITVSFEKKNNMVSTLVTDTGRGIPEADIPKLFTKFGRLERSFATLAKTSGTGLGLYICKQIIDLHQGQIGVTSTVGKGSTFHFSLKIAKGKRKK